MEMDDIGKILKDTYAKPLFEQMLKSVQWKMPVGDNPMYGPTRFDYAQIRVEAFKTAFTEFMKDHPGITFTGTEDGDIGVQFEGSGWRYLDDRT